MQLRNRHRPGLNDLHELSRPQGCRSNGNDLRLRHSRLQAGSGDIRWPARQAGTSDMPGKVNPMIPEAVSRVAFELIGNDAMIPRGCEAGQFQLDAVEPVRGCAPHKSPAHRTQACRIWGFDCVEGIAANHAQPARRVA